MAQDRGFTLWLTGLSGAGKTTLARALGPILRERGLKVERLDGDIVRKNLTKDLGFSKEDRNLNIERVTFVAKLLTRNGVVVLCSFISPYRARRQKSRDEIGGFVECFVDCPLEVLIERDVKGLYKKALAGEIANFTGISDPYEPPDDPEIIVDSSTQTVEESLSIIVSRLEEIGYLDGHTGTDGEVALRLSSIELEKRQPAR